MNEIIKDNTNLGVATSIVSAWMDPYLNPPPRGKVLLLTWDNIQTEGTWCTSGHILYAAWAPKPARPDWLKQRMYLKYTGDFKPQPVETK